MCSLCVHVFACVSECVECVGYIVQLQHVVTGCFFSHQIPKLVWRTPINIHPYSTAGNVTQGVVKVLRHSAATSIMWSIAVKCFMLSGHANSLDYSCHFTTLQWKTLYCHSLYSFIFIIPLKVLNTSERPSLVYLRFDYLSHLLTL